MSFFNKKQETIKCAKNLANSKDNYHNFINDMISKNNRFNLYDHMIHRRNERIQSKKLSIKYGIPTKIKTGFQVENNLSEISFQTLTSKNWHIYMKHAIPKIWNGIIKVKQHKPEQFLLMFQRYELLLNPFKYNPDKIIYIKKINNLNNPSERYNYIVFMYEDYLFYIPFYNESYQSK